MVVGTRDDNDWMLVLRIGDFRSGMRMLSSGEDLKMNRRTYLYGDASIERYSYLRRGAIVDRSRGAVPSLVILSLATWAAWFFL